MHELRFFRNFTISQMLKEKSKILKIAGVQCQKWLEEKYKEELSANSSDIDHLISI